jgi:serine/threonine-protein kinase
MVIKTVASLLDALRQNRLLEPVQLEETVSTLACKFAEPRALAGELVRRDWLSPYQVNQIFPGKGCDLLLGSYVLVERLGEGGMGQVFKARHWKLGHTVALKLLRKEQVSNPDMVRRFYREVRAATQLDHPNIVRALEADEAGGVHFFIMEYAEGTDLGRLIKKGGPLPADRACDYARQVALGLQHAQEKGLVHRDIKPQNLLLTKKEATVKILDMGLARLAPGDEAGDYSTTITYEGMFMGTADYIAPEQAREAHGVDIRADLYSLGCTLYYLLTAKVPFPGGTRVDKVIRHEIEEPVPVERLRPDLPAAVAEVVRRLMAKRVQDRFQTPAEAAAALAVACQAAAYSKPPLPRNQDASRDHGLQETVSWASATEPGPPAAPRRRLWLGLVSGAALLAVAGVLTGWLLRSGPPEGQDGGDRPAPGGPSSDNPGKTGAFRPTSFQLYYGSDAATLDRLQSRMRPGQVIVVDTRVLKKADRQRLLGAAERAGAKVLAYLSIGELNDAEEALFRTFLKEFLKKDASDAADFRTLEGLTLERNPQFNSRRVDVLARAWRAFVLSQADQRFATGMHGLFLDTVDTADCYIGKKDWPMHRRIESVQAMMALVRSVKERAGARFILQNGGLNLVGAKVFVGDASGKEIPGLGLAQGHAHNPDGVLWENAFAVADEWSRRREDELQQVRRSGRATVFVLGYKESLRDAKAFFQRSAAAHFVPAWATSSSQLGRELTVGPSGDLSEGK